MKTVLGCLGQIVGLFFFALGSVFVKEVGIAHLWLPTSLSLLIYWVAGRFLSPTTQMFRPTIAIGGGLFLTELIGISVALRGDWYAPTWAGSTAEAFSLALGLVWLIARPGARSALFLGVVLAVDLAITSFAVTPALRA